MAGAFTHRLGVFNSRVSGLRTATGSYVGTGAKIEVSLPFTPDLVFIYAANQKPAWRDRLAWHGRSQYLDATASSYVIGPNDDDPTWYPMEEAKFSAEASYSVSARTYYYIAVKENGGTELEQVSAIGNNTVGRVFDFTTRSSDLVVVKRDHSRSSVWATATGDAGRGDPADGPLSGAVTITSTGVILSDNVAVNENNNVALGEGHVFLSFSEGGNVRVIRRTGTGGGSTVPNLGVAAFIVDVSGTVEPQIVIDGGSGLGFDGTAPANAVSLASGTLTLPSTYNTLGDEYIVMSLDDSGVAEATEAVLPVATNVARSYGIVELSAGYTLSGACSIEYYGRPQGGATNDWSYPLIALGGGAEGDTSGMNGGIYLFGTDPDANGWLGGVLRVIRGNYMAALRQAPHASINYYNKNTGRIVRFGRPVHVVATHDGSGHWRTYVNGKLAKDSNLDTNNATYGNRVNGGGGTSLPVYANSRLSPRAGELYRAQTWTSELTDAQARALFASARDGSAWSGPAADETWDFIDNAPVGIANLVQAPLRGAHFNIPYFLPSTHATSSASISHESDGGIRATTVAGDTNGRVYTQLEQKAGDTATYRIRSEVSYNDASRIICRYHTDTEGVTGGTVVYDLTGTGVISRTDDVSFSGASGTRYLFFIGVTAEGQSFIIEPETEVVRIA